MFKKVFKKAVEVIDLIVDTGAESNSLETSLNLPFTLNNDV